MSLFKTARRYIANLVKHLPNVLERSVLLTRTIDKYQEKLFAVKEMLNWQIQHLEIHIKQIRETRELHGI